MTEENMTQEIEELIQLQKELEEYEETAAAIREERNALLAAIFARNPETFVESGYRFTQSTTIAYDLDSFGEVDPIAVEQIKSTRKLLKSMESVWKDKAKESRVGITESKKYSATRVG